MVHHFNTYKLNSIPQTYLTAGCRFLTSGQHARMFLFFFHGLHHQQQKTTMMTQYGSSGHFFNTCTPWIHEAKQRFKLWKLLLPWNSIITVMSPKWQSHIEEITSVSPLELLHCYMLLIGSRYWCLFTKKKLRVATPPCQFGPDHLDCFTHIEILPRFCHDSSMIWPWVFPSGTRLHNNGKSACNR